MRRLALLLPSMMLFGGCILGIDDLSGGQTGSDAGAASDDASIGSDGSEPSSDGSSGDSAIILPFDGGPEAGRFCPQTGAYFCEDFDGPDAALPGKFDFVFAPTGSVVVESTAEFTSGPRSLNTVTNATSTSANISKSVSSTNIDIAFDFYLESATSNAALITFSLGSASTAFKPISATVTQCLEEDSLPDGGPAYFTNDGIGGIPTGKWVHLESVLDFPTHVVTLKMNGTQILQRTLDAAHWASAGGARVTLGTGDSTSTSYFYDNVVIRLP